MSRKKLRRGFSVANYPNVFIALLQGDFVLLKCSMKHRITPHQMSILWSPKLHVTVTPLTATNPYHSSNVFQETTELRQPSSPSQLAPSPHWLLPLVQQPTTHPARIGCCSTPNQLPMCWSFMENCHLPFCGWSLISHHYIQLSLLIVSDIINLQHHQLYVRSSHMQPCKSPAFCRSMVQPDGPYLVWGNPPFANDKRCHLVLTTTMTVWDWESHNTAVHIPCPFTSSNRRHPVDPWWNTIYPSLFC